MTESHVRQATFTAQQTDGRTLEGYAAVFNQRTSIQDHLGVYDEVISPGAFKHTIRNGRPVLMFDHGQHPLIGSLPLGTIDELREDAHGLYVRATLTDNWLIDVVRDPIAGGAIDGMSFRSSSIFNPSASSFKLGLYRSTPLYSKKFFFLGSTQVGMPFCLARAIVSPITFFVSTPLL